MLATTTKDDLDTGPRKAPGAERFCAATGDVKPVDDMIRFVVGPDGAAVPDLKRRLPGRGIWITASREALRTAVARKVFTRSFRREVAAGPDLVATTERLLERAALDALGMAHKAARVVTGFTRIEAALAREPVVGLLHASDAAADGVRKLDAALRQRGDSGRIPVLSAFSRDQLDLALGRANVVHAALLASPESETFLARLRRLDRFRTGDKTGGNGRKAAN